MGGTADFKVGVQNTKKICTTTFPNVGYKQVNIYQRINEEEAKGILASMPTERHVQPVYCCVSMLACRFE